MLRRTLSILLLSSLLFAGHVSPVRAEGAITGAASREAAVNVALAITDVQVTGRTGTIPVKLLVTSGTLAMSTTTGLTFTGGQTGSEIYFSGDVANVNAALATLTYTRASTGSDTLEVSLVEPGEVFFSDNGHLYEYISAPSGITWNDAQTAAAALTRYNATGYLTTITSANENAFVSARLEGAGWMGASDVASEGVWRWVTGPETGTNFWNGNGSGSVVTYANWNTSEPNDSGSNEDCGQFLSGGGQNGKWNDLPCSGTTLTGYVVEFGAPGDLPETTGNEFTITTYTPPALSSVSPLDGATAVEPSSNLVMTFDRAVNVGTGNVTLYHTGGTAITSIDVTSGQVTGNGTTTITINPTADLPKRSSLYVLVDATAFDATAGGSYAGIVATTTWNFTTTGTLGGEFYVPVSSPELAIISTEVACDGGVASGVIRLAAQNATQYLLGNDEYFARSTWQAMDGNEVTIPWTFAVPHGEVRVYAALRNSSGSVVHLDAASMAVRNCEIDDQEVGEADDEGDNGGEADQQALRTGPSPWDGVVEIITETEGMQLIRGESYDTVYLLESGTRRPFMNASIYFTWYESFNEVEVVTNATLATIPLGRPMLPQAGSLIKIQSLPEVYLVGARDGHETMQHVPSEAVAEEMFGAKWAERVIDIDVTLFKKFVRL